MINEVKKEKKKIALYLPIQVYDQAYIRAFLGPTKFTTFNAYILSLINADLEKGEKHDHK